MDRRTERRDEGVVIGGAVTRRRFMQYGAGAGAGLVLWSFAGNRAWAAAPPSGVLDPLSIPKYVTPLVIPPAMPQSRKPPGKRAGKLDYYEIAVREFRQQILPPSMGLEPTRVWSYGSVDHPETFNYPAFTIEAIVAPAGPRQVDQRLGQTERRLSAASAADRPDAPLGQSARRAAGPRRTWERPRAIPGTGADRDPPPRRASAARRATAIPRRGTYPRPATFPAGYARRGSRYQRFRAQAQRRPRPGLDARKRGVPVRQRPARDDDVVPRPHARHDPRQRLRRAGRLLPDARRTF